MSCPQQQVFGPAFDTVDHLLWQEALEIRGNRPSQPGLAHPHPVDNKTRNRPGKPPPGGFYLRELRHCF